MHDLYDNQRIELCKPGGVFMFATRSRQFGSVTVIEVQGRVDGISAPRLKEALMGHFAKPDPQLILDLAQVDYLSAAGLRVLRTIHERAGQVRIAQPSQRVREVMQITGLDAVYQLYGTTVEALHHTRPLLNAHTHLELGWLQDSLPPITGMEFAYWIEYRVGRRRAQLAPEKVSRLMRESAEAGAQMLVETGTSIVGDISVTGDSVPALNNAGLNGVIYLELIGRDGSRVEHVMRQLRLFVDKWRPKLHSGLQLGIELHAPYTLHPDYWRLALAYARDAALPLCIHVAESPAETQYLKDGTGPIRDQIYSTLPPLEPLGLSPIEYLERVGALAQQPLLAHAVQVSEADIALIKDYGCAVVHCPRSNIRLQCGRMPLEAYLAQDVPVLLGTDSLASSPSLNIMDEVEFAVALHHGKVTAETILSLTHRNTLI